MPVPPSQLLVLASLEQPRTVAAIASENALPVDTVRKAVRVLEEAGVVSVRKQGADLVATSASKAVPALARAIIFDHPRQDWTPVFHGDRPMVLHTLDRVGHPALTAEVCNKGRRTIYHAIEILGPRGIIVESPDGYGINPRLADLKELLEEIAKARARHRLAAFGSDARLIWHVGPEVLFKSNGQLDQPHVHPGALSAFSTYGVPLVVMRGRYLYLSTRSLDVADAILQGLLAEPESRANRSYCALVYEKHRPKNLGEKARIYGLEEEAAALVRYVEERQPGARFLPWDEHDAYRQQYGVGT